MTLRFDGTSLRGGLDRLPSQLKVAFATACAERLFPAYVAFSSKTSQGDPEKLRTVLNRLWDDLAGNQMTDHEIQRNLAECMGFIPKDSGRAWVAERDFAEDAVSSIAYALRCRATGSSQEAVWSAQCVYEAVDRFVINSENVDLAAPGMEEHVLLHRFVQAELVRQRRDLVDLLGSSEGDVGSLLAALKERARSEAPALLVSGQ